MSPRSTSFDEFYRELEDEAQAEGLEAIRDLRAKEVKYALINALITRRRELNLTQERLAEESGVAQTEISRIERGRKSPTMDTFSRLASALRLDFWRPATRAPRLSMSMVTQSRRIDRARFPVVAKRSLRLSESARELGPRANGNRGGGQKARKGKSRRKA
jgi:transcriptional regulator with XRE-family HTH domain